MYAALPTVVFAAYVCCYVLLCAPWPEWCMSCFVLLCVDTSDQHMHGIVVESGLPWPVMHMHVCSPVWFVCCCVGVCCGVSRAVRICVMSRSIDNALSAYLWLLCICVLLCVGAEGCACVAVCMHMHVFHSRTGITGQQIASRARGDVSCPVVDTHA